MQQQKHQQQQQQQLQKQRQTSTASISSSSSSSPATSQVQSKQPHNLATSQNHSAQIPQPPKEYASQPTQTTMPTKTIKIKLNNLNVYAQQSNAGMCVLASLDQIELDNHKSNSTAKKNDAANQCMDVMLASDINKSHTDAKKEDAFSLVICFKKIDHDLASQDGLAELVIENFQFEVDIPVLIGLLELVDDNDFYEPHKKTLPVNILLKNSKFCLNDNPGERNKPLHVSINKLLVNKLSNNEIAVSEMSLAPDLFKNTRSFNLRSLVVNKNISRQTSRYRRKSLSKEIEYESQFKLFKQESLLSFSYKSIHDSINADQFASLVYLLRKTKEENRKLQLELRVQREEKSSHVEKNAMSLSHHREEKLAISAPKEDVNGFLIADKSELDRDKQLIDKFEVERRQFESLLKKYQEENDVLRLKLANSEQNFLVLNNERDSLIKKLNANNAKIKWIWSRIYAVLLYVTIKRENGIKTV